MNIKISILNVLNACGTWALPKHILKAEVEANARVKFGDGEFNDALVQLKDKSLVATRVDDLQNDTLYFITEQGKTKVQQ